MPRGKAKKKKTAGKKATPVRAAKAKAASKTEEIELDLSVLEDEDEVAPITKVTEVKTPVKDKKGIRPVKNPKIQGKAEPNPEVGEGRPAVLFPGVLPGPLEPNAEVLSSGAVDLRALRSGLHLIILQAQAAIGSIEVLEYTQRKIQEQVKEKE